MNACKDCVFANKISGGDGKYICFKREYSEYTGLVHGTIDGYVPCEKVRKDIQFSSLTCTDFVERLDNALYWLNECSLLDKFYKDKYKKKLDEESSALKGCSIILLILVVIIIISAILT